MVYDRTDSAHFEFHNQDDTKHGRGFAIHSEATEDMGTLYTLYTDDGRGNGDYVCQSTDQYWIKRIALALDSDGIR